MPVNWRFDTLLYSIYCRGCVWQEQWRETEKVWITSLKLLRNIDILPRNMLCSQLSCGLNYTYVEFMRQVRDESGTLTIENTELSNYGGEPSNTSGIKMSLFESYRIVQEQF
jgi:hypothetical protein